MQRLAWRTTDIDDTLKFSREVCHNGRFFALLGTAITPRAPPVRATPATLSERKVCTSRLDLANAKSVGAGLLANAVGQTTSAPQQNRLRGQARSYSRSGQRRQPSVNANSVGAGLLANAVDQTTSVPQQNRLRGQARSYSQSGQRRQPSVNAKSVGAGLLANAADQATSVPQQNRLRGQGRSYSRPCPTGPLIRAVEATPYPSTWLHCLLNRLSEIGTLVPSCWANSETRYSSSHQR
jgi:hypothetical protein